MATSEKIVPHTLFSRKIRPIRNWHEWLERWQEAQSIEEMLGLLHVGFSVRLERGEYGEPEYEVTDRYLFYLGIADGWNDQYLLQHTEDDGEYTYGVDDYGHRVYRSTAYLRQVLARKAFDMLAFNFFNRSLYYNDHQKFAGFWPQMVPSELFPAIQHFFRAQPARFGRSIEVPNLSGREKIADSEKNAIHFISNLAVFIWEWEEPDHYYGGDEEKRQEEGRERKARLNAAKPWMVEVLEYINRLDVLWKYTLDDSCLKKLMEIALRAEVWEREQNKHRNVCSLEEAIYAGSVAAKFLHLFTIVRREYTRLEAIREAQIARIEAERTIRELSQKK